MLLKYQTHLPIYQKKDQILDTLEKNQVVVIAGETGSGKTTQLPLFCLEAGRKNIVCTQPRRLAAISLANYVSSCLGSVTGKEVGFQVRFREKVSNNTRIKFVTDGILLSSIVNGPLLLQYDTIIIDEAHERSINIDFLLGYFRTLLAKRPDLKIIISSATIDTRLFSRAFNHAPVITVSGRLYPMSVLYRPVIELWKGESMSSYIEGAIVSVKEIIEKKEPGDILIFLPTVQDIFELKNRLEYCIKEPCDLLTLHSRLPETQQQLIFKKSTQRKIVIATNIAETSITVPGIRFVIDSGLVRMLRYESSANLSRMPIERISKAAADQRAGRCGRVEAGVCIRLFSETDYMSRPFFTTPEIQRANLAGVILQMSHIGLGDPVRFPFIQRPSNKAIANALLHLRELGAIYRKGELTPVGKKMAILPLDPPISRMLIYAREHDAIKELMVIAAGLSVEGPFLHFSEQDSKKKSRFRHSDSDFLNLLSIWMTYNKILRKKQTTSDTFYEFCKLNGLSPVHMKEWLDAYQQIRRICRTIKGFVVQKSKRASYDAIHKSILSGFYSGIAKQTDKNTYSGLLIHGIKIFPSSVLFDRGPQWVLFHEIVETGKIYGRTAATIRPEWIEMIFRSKCQYRYEDPWFDPQSGKVKAREEVTFHGLQLIKNRYIELESKDPEQAHEIFVKEGLVNEMAGEQFRFIRHNHEVRDQIKIFQHKLRKNLYAGDWALEEFYNEQIGMTKNVKELFSLIKMHKNDSFLMVPLEVLLAVDEPLDVKDYPDCIFVGNAKCPVSYLFCPGDPCDGATVSVNQEIYDSVPEFYWEWVLPVYWKPRIELILQSIKEHLVVVSVDIQDVIEKIYSYMNHADGPFVNAVCSLLREHYNVNIYSSDITISNQQLHLWPIIKVMSGNNKCTAAFRALINKPLFTGKYPEIRSPLWADFCKVYEEVEYGIWKSNLLKRVPILSEKQRVGIMGYPALYVDKGQISVRVFFSYAAASDSHGLSVKYLLEVALSETLAWEMESVKFPVDIMKKFACYNFETPFDESIKDFILNRILQLSDTLPVDESSFERICRSAAEMIPLTIIEIAPFLQKMVAEYESCSKILKKKREKYKNTYLESMYDELMGILDSYIVSFFSLKTEIDYKLQIPDFLNAFNRRIEFAYNDSVKYHSKVKIFTFYKNAIEQITNKFSRMSYEVQWKKDHLLIDLEWYLIQQISLQPVKNVSLISESDLQGRIEELQFDQE